MICACGLFTLIGLFLGFGCFFFFPSPRESLTVWMAHMKSISELKGAGPLFFTSHFLHTQPKTILFA